MKHLLVTIAAMTLACAVRAAESVPQPAQPDPVRILEGQRKFLNASISFCQEQVPALKADLTAARAHAEAELNKAENQILGETENNRKIMARYLEMYSARWSKYADDQMVAMKRLNADKACPTLVASWSGTEAEVVVEDWHNFLQQFGPDSAQ